MKERIESLRVRLSQIPLEALLVSKPENLRYLSGFSGGEGFILISKQAQLLAVDFRYLEQVAQQAPDFQLFRLRGDLTEHLADLAATVGVKQVGFESAHLTFLQYQQLSKASRDGGLEFVPTSGLVEELRIVKEPGELSLIQKAAEVTDLCFEHVRRIVSPGMTERQLCWEIEKFMREAGADGLAFDTIVASGPNAALPHAQPGGRALAPGEPIVVDMGARWQGYCSDFTRTICLGEPDETFRKVYAVTLQANEAAARQIRAGMMGQAADDLARRVIVEAGYGESFGHGLGHGVGLEIHEAPRLRVDSRDVLSEGMVFTIEPGIYLPGWGGVRIEDLAVLETGGSRLLSLGTKDPVVPLPK
ncbi:MAG: aminopeptidase P family protein [Chloroflexota bacterium]|nr:MAG: aminopeptidase P family protein [Chloroflexota bacterium]